MFLVEGVGSLSGELFEVSSVKQPIGLSNNGGFVPSQAIVFLPLMPYKSMVSNPTNSTY